MSKWTPDKITALILICSCIALMACRIDGEVKSILTIASGYLFGVGIQEHGKYNGGVK